MPKGNIKNVTKSAKHFVTSQKAVTNSAGVSRARIQSLPFRKPSLYETDSGSMKNFMDGWSNMHTNRKELVSRATQYFDLGGTDYVAAPFTQIKFDLVANSIFENNTVNDSVRNIARVTKFKLECLPLFNPTLSEGFAKSNFLVCFGVPVRVQGVETTAAQEATFVTPTSVADWVTVGEWDAKTLFHDGTVQPESDAANQVLCCVHLVDPDTGVTLKSPGSQTDAPNVQFRYTVEYAQTLPTLAAIQADLPSSETPAWVGTITGSSSKQPAQVVLVGTRNCT